MTNRSSLALVLSLIDPITKVKVNRQLDTAPVTMDPLRTKACVCVLYSFEDFIITP